MRSRRSVGGNFFHQARRARVDVLSKCSTPRSSGSRFWGVSATVIRSKWRRHMIVQYCFALGPPLQKHPTALEEQTKETPPPHHPPSHGMSQGGFYPTFPN